ncbi:uncharacterized protein BCR38DRAFT_70468 [Pseudomassariella vexata]|uniref:Uncharacterized protein n=1 Tax=Pseudomassariella vexata TaxID=1141098 RepID=A0A1Y2DJ36_9PEZI|nr:uncharacterized protein BCR38DRAFT_70468 [Pseudomassariella vexata]ORY58825.1 hypothetical protein BCR38DRAFT_70468 [Pseudomassariella vexata]
MPKRPLDSASVMPTTERVPPVKAQKTERSHEENQERAYIAASRRADRSLEARVQSARMASEIHRRRTGRGLKVTEEIVIKEEMYEEEEDDLPRQYKYLAAHLQTNSADMNSRVSAYITTQAAMATMARYNEVNRLFNESFPTAMSYQQQLNQSLYMGPLMNNGGNQYIPTSPIEVTSPPSRNHSTPGQSQLSSKNRRISTSSTPNVTAVSSPPSLSPGSTSETPDSRSTPYQTPMQAFPPLDPQLVQQHPSSFFTSELPNEIKMMANIDMNDPMAAHFLGSNISALQMFGQHSEESVKHNVAQNATEPTPASKEASGPNSPHDSVELEDDTLFSPIDDFYDPFNDYNRLGTPAAGMSEGAWESFVDFGSEQ